jgi:hypothetical protein
VAATKGTPAPASFAEGANGIVMAITAAMTAPDSGPHLPLLEQMLKAMVGTIQGGAGAQQQPKPPMGGGGTNLGQLQGQPGMPPSAGPGAPQSPATTGGAMGSPSGVSADDMRRAMAAQGATPS